MKRNQILMKMKDFLKYIIKQNNTKNNIKNNKKIRIRKGPFLHLVKHFFMNRKIFKNRIIYNL